MAYIFYAFIKDFYTVQTRLLFVISIKMYRIRIVEIEHRRKRPPTIFFVIQNKHKIHEIN